VISQNKTNKLTARTWSETIYYKLYNLPCSLVTCRVQKSIRKGGKKCASLWRTVLNSLRHFCT